MKTLRPIPLVVLVMTGAALLLGGTPRSAATKARTPLPQSQLIQHVVIIFQENRSFDDMFYGYPGADTATGGYNSHGTYVALQPIPLEAGYDIDHTSGAFFSACDGTGSIRGTDCKMDGFDQEYSQSHNSNSQYGYVPANESQPYFNMASQYVLSDRTFTSHIDASFISHQYIIAAQAHKHVDLPSGTWGCDGGKTDTLNTLLKTRAYGARKTVCQNYKTLGDELNTAGLSWRMYAQPLGGDSGNIWSSYQVIKHIRYTNQWTEHVISPSSKFLTDVAGGTLSAVTWVMPSRGDSDHPDAGSNTGPSWVTSVVNAVGTSQYWNSTAIFLMWDDRAAGTTTCRHRTSISTAWGCAYH